MTNYNHKTKQKKAKKTNKEQLNKNKTKNVFINKSLDFSQQ